MNTIKKYLKVGVVLFLYLIFGVNTVSALYGLPGYYSYSDSRIDNISSTNYEDVVKIGENYWVKQDLDDVEPDERLGELMFVFIHITKDQTERSYGEKVSLWIYNIEPIMQQRGIDRDSVYSCIYTTLLADTSSMWEETNVCYPLKAFKTNPTIIIPVSKEDSTIIIKEKFIIFGSDRIYCINFFNDKINNLRNIHKIFDRRCKSIVKSIDLRSYYERELEEIEREKTRKEQREIIFTIFSIMSLLFLFISVTIIKKIGKENIHARNMAIYSFICFILGLVISGFAIWDMYLDEAIVVLVFVIFHFVITFCIEKFLVNRSHKEYEYYYLIPQWFLSNYKVKNEYSKRLLMIFLIYPLFFVVSIPFIGIVFFLFYIIPVLFILGIIRLILWVMEGKKIDAQSTYQNDKARLYCRHCGKLIDADSDYCRYCGKKL